MPWSVGDATARPLVAISEGLADYGDYYGVGYPRPLLAAGAFPVLLPYFDDPADRREAISRADGLVLAGGRDIEPGRYGRAEPHPEQLAPAWKLDEIELDYATARGGRRPCRCSASAADARSSTSRSAARSTATSTSSPRGAPITQAPGGTSGEPWSRQRSPASRVPPIRRIRSTSPRARCWPSPRRALRRRQLPPSGDRPGRRRAHRHRVRAARHGRGGRDAGAPAFVLGVQWELHEEWQDDDRTPRASGGPSSTLPVSDA